MNVQYIDTFRAGSSGYYDSHRRGTVDIWHDSKRYIYKVSGNASTKRVKRQILSWFEEDSRTCYKISGRYPSYSIESI